MTAAVAVPAVSLRRTAATTLSWLAVWWLPLLALALVGGQDLLLEIGHESISGTDQAIERLDALRATAGEKPKSVILLLIEGPNGPRYVGLKSGDD